MAQRQATVMCLRQRQDTVVNFHVIAFQVRQLRKYAGL